MVLLDEVGKIEWLSDHLAKIYLLIEADSDNPRLYRRALITVRFIVRAVLTIQGLLKTGFSMNRRHKVKMGQEGVTVLFIENTVREYERQLDACEELLIHYGESTFLLLDEWQKAGATVRDLFDLCWANRNVKMPEKLAPTEFFSSYALIHHIDYANEKDDFIRWEVDGPFSHASIEWFTHELATNPAGRAAARKVFQEIFPGSMIANEDENGDKCLFSPEGEFVGEIL